MATGSLASIEPDERGFWHVNFWLEHPDEEGIPPDGFATTEKGAALDAAIALAAKFEPTRVAVWEPCEHCNGTGMEPDLADEWPCDECTDGMTYRYLDLCNP